jgi:hypothetical protein
MTANCSNRHTRLISELFVNSSVSVLCYFEIGIAETYARRLAYSKNFCYTVREDFYPQKRAIAPWKRGMVPKGYGLEKTGKGLLKSAAALKLGAMA